MRILERVFGLPRGSYPTPFLGYLVLWLGSVILKSRRPKNGVRYEPLGRVEGKVWAPWVQSVASGGTGVAIEVSEFCFGSCSSGLPSKPRGRVGRRC